MSNDGFLTAWKMVFSDEYIIAWYLAAFARYCLFKIVEKNISLDTIIFVIYCIVGKTCFLHFQIKRLTIYSHCKNSHTTEAYKLKSNCSPLIFPILFPGVIWGSLCTILDTFLFQGEFLERGIKYPNLFTTFYVDFLLLNEDK